MKSYLYLVDKKVMESLSDFLFKHQTGEFGHHLFFRSSHDSKYMDGQDGWTEVKV